MDNTENNPRSANRSTTRNRALIILSLRASASIFIILAGIFFWVLREMFIDFTPQMIQLLSVASVAYGSFRLWRAWHEYQENKAEF